MADSGYEIVMNNNIDNLKIDINVCVNDGAYVVGPIKYINNNYVQTVTRRDFTFNSNTHLEYRVITANTFNHLYNNVNQVLNQKNQRWHCVDGASVVGGFWTQTLVKIWENK